MAKPNARDPRSNLYELLANDSSAGDAPKKKAPQKPSDKKDGAVGTDKKEAPKPVVGATPTPAAIAAERKKKEEQKAADKAKVEELKKADGTQPAANTTTTAPPEKKKTRKEWEATEFAQQQQQQDEASEGFKTVTSNRKRVDKDQQDNADNQGYRQNGPRPEGGRGGRGQGRGGRRGGGRRPYNPDDPRPPRLEENRNRDVNQRGVDLSEGHEKLPRREFDRKSGMNTTRNQKPRKKGVGLGTYGPTDNQTEPAPTEQPADQTTGWEQPDWDNVPAAQNPDAAPAENQEAGGEQEQNETATDKPAQPAKPTQKSFDDFEKERQKKNEELAAILASIGRDSAKPRVVETVDDPKLKPRENQKASADTPVQAVPEKEKKEKVVPDKEKKEKTTKTVQEIPFQELSFKLPSEDGPSRGNRGGRRGGRQGRRDDDQGNQEEGQQNQQQFNAPRGGRGQGRGRGRGGRGRGGRGQNQRQNNQGQAPRHNQEYSHQEDEYPDLLSSVKA